MMILTLLTPRDPQGGPQTPEMGIFGPFSPVLGPYSINLCLKWQFFRWKMKDLSETYLTVFEWVLYDQY